jgi:hypothetical protein
VALFCHLLVAVTLLQIPLEQVVLAPQTLICVVLLQHLVAQAAQVLQALSLLAVVVVLVHTTAQVVLVEQIREQAVIPLLVVVVV